MPAPRSRSRTPPAPGPGARAAPRTAARTSHPGSPAAAAAPPGCGTVLPAPAATGPAGCDGHANARRARPVQRERVDHRPAASFPVKVVERPQHRLAVVDRPRRIPPARRRLARHRVDLAGKAASQPLPAGLGPPPAIRAARARPGDGAAAGPRPGPRFGCLPDPQAEIPPLHRCRLLPADIHRRQEPPPAQHVHRIRPQRQRSPRGSQQLPQERRDRSHHSTVRVDQPVRLQRIVRGRHASDTRHHQCGDVTLMRLGEHERRP